MLPLSFSENPPSIGVERFSLLWLKGKKSQFFAFNASNIALNKNIQEYEMKVHQISHKTCSYIFPLSLIRTPQNGVRVSHLIHVVEIM